MTNEPCKGLWFRINHDRAMTQRGVSLRIQMRLLKKDSCPGCPKCIDLKYKLFTLRGMVDNLHLKQHGQKCRLRLKKKET